MIKDGGTKIHKVPLDTAGEPEAETEVLQSFALVRGVGAGQAGHLAAQPKPPLDVQRAAVPRFIHSNKAGFVHRHVGDAGRRRASSGQRRRRLLNLNLFLKYRAVKT